jgi:hypothetical protein
MYDIFDHVHRISSWAAGTAVRRGRHFSVKDGQLILSGAGFPLLLRKGLEGLPSPEAIDSTHRFWRENVIGLAGERGLSWSHGLAAKLINVYLKVAYVGIFSHDDPRVNALHPPIDRVLLNKLSEIDVGNRRRWSRYRDRGWTRFDSREYEEVINAFRAALGPGVPLWKIEREWPGYQ